MGKLYIFLALGVVTGWIGHRLIMVSHTVATTEVSRIDAMFRAAGLN